MCLHESVSENNVKFYLRGQNVYSNDLYVQQ